MGRQQVHPDLWVKLMLRRWDEVRHSGSPRMVVTDVRFDNEASAIVAAGGTVWWVERGDLPAVAAHVSEAGVNRALITGVVKNRGSIDELDANIQHWVGFLSKRYSK